MYNVEEFPEVWADACVRDSEGRFLFLSVFGRDGSLMQFIAAMELEGKERGVSRFNLIDKDKRRHMIEVGGTDRLSKHSTRFPKQNLFGPLNQMWVFDKGLHEPDRANRIGWALDLAEAEKNSVSVQAALRAKAWQLVNSLSPVALLDHWQDDVMAWCSEKNAIQQMGCDVFPVLGNVNAMRVSLTDHFLAFISDSVKNGRLRLK